MEAHISHLQERESELRRVVASHQLEFWHQPIFRLATGRVEAFESLLRWRKPNGVVESFAELLQVAEESGLSVSIGRDSIESACRKLLEWDRAVPANGLSIAVNLTQRQFYHDQLVPQMQKVFAESGVNPARIVFEISESTLNVNTDRAVALLQHIVDCEARIALDNFGSSLAPMNHLLRLPLHLVKLDSKFTMAASGAGRKLAIVESLIHVCKAVGVQLLAQGIETQEQLMVMHSLGCELGQGFVFAPALDSTTALNLVARNAQSAADSSLS
jgi:EAL domain-containing protein (putative c-di-GMP-specific phosphodiesterase class I)